MRELALVVVLVSAASVSAQPKCPFDAKVRELSGADAGVFVDTVARLRVMPEVKRWLRSEARTCKFETTPRLVRVLEGLSQRCALALIELQLETDPNCRDLEIRVGGGPQRMYAQVTADAKGSLKTWPFIASEDPVPPARTPEIARVECGGSLNETDGGVAQMQAIVQNPTLHFDGCTVRGIDEATVRREVQSCLASGSSPDVTVRFFENEVDEPSCVVTTAALELESHRIAVVRSGVVALDNGGGLFFRSSPAYFEQSDSGARWICADLGLREFTPSPFESPASAREGCTPPKRLESVVVEAERRTGWEHFVVERHDLPIGTTEGPLRVDRVVLEQGRALENEAELVARLKAAALSFAACPGASAIRRLGGKLVFTGSGSIATGYLNLVDPRAADQACLNGVMSELRKFGGKPPRFRHGIIMYGFTMRAP